MCVPLSVGLLGLAGVFSSVGAVDLILGHFEYQLDYELPENGPADGGWQTSISYDLDGSFADNEGVVRLDTDGVRLLAAPSSRIELTNPFPPFGLEEGNSLWLLSQNNIQGELFLLASNLRAGPVQTNVGERSSPLGSIGTSAVSVTGTGPQRGGEFACG